MELVERTHKEISPKKDLGASAFTEMEAVCRRHCIQPQEMKADPEGRVCQPQISGLN